MSMKLRDLIRKVRACKTAAEERAVIAKESAMIRTAIREEQEHYRHRNVAKLLFMHMLGYPTHFGQLECMKLMASPHFPEKRIGYLGMMLLLSEEADVLMLATNSLKNDLNSDNKFVAGLALCAIGNLATADMSRDLAPEVDKHLKSSLPYLRKKANLAMARCLTKCPDMVEDFVERVVSLLKDKSHGVLVTVVQLMTQVLVIDYENSLEEEVDPYGTDCRRAFLRLVPMLVKMLRNLLSSGYSPEYDVAGISDPFLQVQLLTLLRLLGAKNEKASEEMNDVLAQVATNTDTSKNAGNAILYECVQTIMGIESEDGLRVLAVNILGRFLLNRDNNIRYVALNTLSRCIVEQKQLTAEVENEADAAANESANSALTALQKHRNTVVDCLKDPDVTIRQRALELIYHLVNRENVQALTAELLNYLVLCPREHRNDICTRILRVVDHFSPDDRWRVDTLITMLTIAGREASREVQSATIIYISRAAEDVHSYATHKLLKAIRDDDGSQHGLLTVSIWCIGEFGDLLLNPYSHAPTPQVGDSSNGAPISFMELDPSSVVHSVETVIKRHSCPEEIKERALTCFAKLSDRYADKGDAAALSKLDGLIKKHQDSHSLELQLRACEYDALLHAAKGLKLVLAKPVKAEDDIFGVSGEESGGAVSEVVKGAAKEALARMPVVDLKMLHRRQAADAFAAGKKMPGIVAPSGISPGSDDLLDIFGESTPVAAPAAAAETNGTSGAEAGKSDLDILADVFAASAAPPAAGSGGYDPFSAPVPTQGAGGANPMDMFGAAPQTAPAASTSAMDLFGGGAAAAAAAVPAPAAVNPLDLFGAPPSTAPASQSRDMFGGNTAPASAGLDMFGSAPAPQAQTSPLDMFGAQPAAPAPAPKSSDPFASMASAPAPADLNPLDLYGASAPAPAASNTMDMFGSTPAQQQQAPAVPPVQAQQNMMASMQAAPPATTDPGSVTVTGFTHQGLTVDFVCTKPDTWNKQVSELVATCKNSADAPLYGFNMQCAVPKYVTMEMGAPSSTTIAVSGGNAKLVTQKIKVTNSQLGTNKLKLRLKIAFTLNGNKVEHMATCADFPQGEY